MQATKQVAELSTLLVTDMYGELPSRILTALLLKGRSSVQQLAHYTALHPRQLRHGLAVLLQQNLLYYHTDRSSSATTYEANPEAAYNIIRSGKVIAMVGSEYGAAAQYVVQSLMALGHARISDLEHAFTSRVKTRSTTSDGESTNGFANSMPQRAEQIESVEQLYDVLIVLASDDILELVGEWSFESPDEVFHRIEDAAKEIAAREKSSAKIKLDQQIQMLANLREAFNRGKGLKRRLGLLNGSASKKRRLANGEAVNSHNAPASSKELDPQLVMRVNEERCLVKLRNQQLAVFAADSLGETTGQVYHTLLRLLTKTLPRCHMNPRFFPEEIAGEPVEEGQTRQPSVSSLDILAHLDPSVNVSHGIGRASNDKIDVRTAERIKTDPSHDDVDSDDPDFDEPIVRGGAGGDSNDEDVSDVEDTDEDKDDVVDSRARKRPDRVHSAPNGRKTTRVTFDDGTSVKDSRLECLRQHLLLLAESGHQFVRHSGVEGRGQWTVDFGALIDNLRQAEIDAVIEASFGRHGLRLSRILREKGKLEDKALPLLALMKKSDVHTTMLAMQVAGFVDVQEVPKDPTHKARNTIYLRYFDQERARGKLLDNTYKAMVRCLQTLEVHRHAERNILSFVDRKDVKGKEKEVMSSTHYNRYNCHLELQEKLLGQLMRLDDLVAVLRDY